MNKNALQFFAWRCSAKCMYSTTHTAYEMLFFKKLENVSPRFSTSFSGIHLYLLASKESSMVGESSYQIRVDVSASFCLETKQKGGVAQS